MNSDASRRAEFDRLVAALCDERLSKSETLRLEELILSDADLRSRYLTHLQIHAIVARRGQRTGVEVDSDREPDLGPETDRTNTLYRFVPQWVRGASVLNRYSGAAAILLAALVFYGSFTLLAWNLRPGADVASSYLNGHEQILDSTQPTDPEDLAARPIVARVLAVQNDRWLSADGENAPRFAVGSKLVSERALDLVAGLIEVQLIDGARVVVEGPASFSFQTANMMELVQGKITARVPPSAIGFAVQTPQAKIVDLGTEFGVEADETGQTSVEVFKGQVEVNYVSAAGATGTPHNVVRMNAGQAKQFSKRDGAAVNVVDVRPGMKQRRTKNSPAIAPINPEQDAVSQKYAAAVLADRPLAYWRLTDGETGIAADASGHGFKGSYSGAMRSNQSGMWPGSSDRGVRFLGPESPGWLEMNDVEVPASYSVEMWVRSALPIWRADAWFMTSRAPHGLLMTPVLDERAWRFVVFDKNIVHCTVGWHTPDKIDDRFHQYVGTYDSAADHGCMYFDGTLVAEAQPLVGDKGSHEPRKLKLFIGRDEPIKAKGQADGWMDEVAIYPAVLSADAVRNHFEQYRSVNFGALNK